MDGDEFRSLALSLPEAEERAHMGHPDFRVHGKIFATLRADERGGVVMLTPQDQALLIASEPKVYQPVKGAWGKRGCTEVRLAGASEPSVRQALVRAWRNKAPKRVVALFDEEQP